MDINAGIDILPSFEAAIWEALADILYISRHQ